MEVRQLQPLPLQPVLQLQCIIFKSISGATFTSDIIGTSSLLSIFQPQLMISLIYYTHLCHNLKTHPNCGIGLKIQSVEDVLW